MLLRVSSAILSLSQKPSPLEATVEALNEYEISAPPTSNCSYGNVPHFMPKIKAIFYYLNKVKKTIVKDQRRRDLVVTMAVIWSGR